MAEERSDCRHQAAEGKEIRPWTDSEKVAYEKRWPIGTKQRTAYELMRNIGTARADVHAIEWKQVDEDGVSYARSKTGVEVDSEMPDELRVALDATPRTHASIIITAFGKPFTVDGFSGFMRDAMNGGRPAIGLQAARSTQVARQRHG